MKDPKISIITCTLNSAEHITDCLNSLNEQLYNNFEHIVIDGGSTDGTLELIRKFSPGSLIFREPARGIYPALNRGLKEASGEVVGLLHSDDVFCDKKALWRVALAFTEKEVDYYCSRMLVCDNGLKDVFAVLGASSHKPTIKEMIYASNYYAHPTYYLNRKALGAVGEYDERYRIASDIDWLIRLEKQPLKFHFDSRPLVKLRTGGQAANEYFKALAEEFVIRIRHEGLSFKWLLIYSYHFSRRMIRFILGLLGLGWLIGYFRKVLMKIS